MTQKENLENLTEQERQDLVDRCVIWQAGDEAIADLGKSMPGFHIVVAELLNTSVQPEKISYDNVVKVCIDYFGSNNNIEDCIKKYNLR